MARSCWLPVEFVVVVDIVVVAVAAPLLRSPAVEVASRRRADLEVKHLEVKIRPVWGPS